MNRRGILSVCWLACAACSPRTDPRPAEVQAAAARATPVTSGEQQSSVDRAAYLPKVIPRNVKSSAYEHLGKHMAFVSGEIKNTGDKTVDEAEITVYFLDSVGKRVHEDRYHPVAVSYGSGETSVPLRPNYTRQWTGGFEVPSDWAGKVEVVVSDVKFATAQ